jgi:putative zinc finger protein
MQASGSGRSGPAQFESELRRSLYRFDCPDAHTLGEYQLDVLDERQRTQVAAHAAECDECRGELQTLRTFLAEPVRVPESPLGRARRIVATLFAPSPGLAYGGLRGAADTATRVFEAGDVTVTLGPGHSAGSLFGLVVSASSLPDELEGREVRLSPREGAKIVTQLDDLGNFELTGLSAGPYAVEIDLPDGLVVIEELQVDFA